MSRLHRVLLGISLFGTVIPSALAAEPVSGREQEGILRIDLLPSAPGNPRNSEGDFIPLKDGRILFIYTHFTGGAGDESEAYLASRVSSDGGKTWSADDVVVIARESQQNVMSVSLLRLKDGRIALFYLRKESDDDCRPVMRISSDEAMSWSDAVEVIPDSEIGYYVLNNDRVIQLADGRLVLPLAQHHAPGWEKWTPYAKIVCYLSDDTGRTWARGSEAPAATHEERAVMFHEPGIVELADGRLLMLIRTNAGSQFVAWSSDRGKTWTRPQPSELTSPVSPATIEQIPGTNDLLLVWNDHRNVPAELRGKRTPLRIALSHDNAATWSEPLTLEDLPEGWFCYIALEVVDDHILLGYCAGDRRKNNGLAETRITRLPLAKLRASK